MIHKRLKFLSTLVILALVISLVSSAFFMGPLVRIGRADPGDISDSYYNSTTLNVTVLQHEPRILWYDFQYNNSGSWESRLNAQIDVNDSAEYRFIVNISCDDGWDNITTVDIWAWADLGDDTTEDYATHNASKPGGNTHLHLQYDNSSGSASFSMLWPDDEVTFVSADSTESPATDPDGSPYFTEARNLTFAFIPSYQFRYAPDPTTVGEGFNDLWSWNFNITADTDGGYKSYDNPSYGDCLDEFGVYSYTEIVSAGWPSIVGAVGHMSYTNGTGGSGNISIVTRTNGNYSFSVNVTNLTHDETGSHWIDNTSIYVAGGDLSLTNFTGNAWLYFYGGAASYKYARNESVSLTTDPVQWGVDIDLAQYPGDYTATIYYHLKTEL